MSNAPDPALVEVAEVLQHQLYYNGEILDLTIDAVQGYKDQSIACVRQCPVMVEVLTFGFPVILILRYILLISSCGCLRDGGRKREMCMFVAAR